MVGDSASDGIPLLTRVLLVRATARFDPSFPSDANRGTASSPLPIHTGRSPTAATTPPYTETGAVHVSPTLRIIAHYAQSKNRNNTSNSAHNTSISSNSSGRTTSLPAGLRSANRTPKGDAEFFASHATLHQLLNSLASDRLSEKVKMRQVQTDIARTTVKLARASAVSTSSSTNTGGTTAAAAFPDTGSFFSSSLTTASSYSARQRSGLLTSTTSVDDENIQSDTTSSNKNNASSPQVHGMLAAVTATFAEDAAWRSLTTPHRPQLNPWSLTSVSDEGCYLSLPSPAYVHWCELQAARCCATVGPDIGSTEPDVENGPMRYNDVVHFLSVDGARKGSTSFKNSSTGEEAGYLHGYAFLLDGAVFTGTRESKDAVTGTTAAAVAPFSDEDGEVSVLLWCVLSDAPVFSFMRALTLEVVAAMSYVAQRIYHTTAEAIALKEQGAAGSTAGSRAKTGICSDVYTSLLDSTLDEEVVRPLAAELLVYGTVASRTLPGENFTVVLPLARGGQTGVAARPQTSSMSGSLTLRRPLDLLFPYADVPLSVLLLSFGEDALRVLQSLLLQEERIVVIGATPQHASACVVSLLSLIAPFTWVSPFVPYLPPHTAAHTGLLYTLLSAPYELQQQNRQQFNTPVSSRPAPYSGGVASQTSQQMESAGFLLGSTAGIRPYLMFLTSFGVTEEGGTRGPRSGRSPRVWIADARTGAVGVCPTEPVSQFLLADTIATDVGEGEEGDFESSKGLKSRSCTAHGGASAWTFPAHIDLCAAAPHLYTHGSGSSSSGGSPRGGARNPYVLYTAVRNSLRTAAELNVMDATPLDVLPPFNDELCDALRRAAPPEKRRQFRRALEELTRHTRERLDNLACLAARLVRQLRQTLKAVATAPAATAPVSLTTIRNNNSGDPLLLDSFSADILDSSGSYSSSESDSDSEVDVDFEDTFQIDENASFRAVTEAVAQSHSVTFPDLSSSNYLAQLPTLSSHETWQVQSAFLGYVVGRLTGAYRRGLTVISGASHRGRGKRRFMDASVFLAPGLDQHYTLAETVARTHLFRQFECAVLAAETVGLRHVLNGCGLQIGGGNSNGSNETDCCGGRFGETHVMMKYVRPLAMFAILCDRARLQYPELYTDVPGLDAVGAVYATLVKRCFMNQLGPPAAVSLPHEIRSIAGNSSSSDPNRAAVISSNSNGTYSSSGNSGGLRGFFSKAIKAMKLHGSSNNGGGGGGGSGGCRGLPVLYIPASIACFNSFTVAPFSAQHVAPESFNITTYDIIGSHGKPRQPHRRGSHLHHTYGSHIAATPNNTKKGGCRHKKASLAALYAIPVKPQRQQWARQQQHQQSTAISMDFTLDECSSVVRNYNVPGGVSGSLTSSFSASTAAALSGGGGGGGGVTNGSVYVNGMGIDAAVLTALARSGGSNGNDAATRVMAEASLSICHALPLDIVHQFDAYEPLLAPVLNLSTSTSPSSTGFTSADVVIPVGMRASAVEADVMNPVAYMAVGLLCPSCVSVWREGEARASRVLQEQQQQQSRKWKVNASPPTQAHSVSSQLPPKPVRMFGASTPLEAQSWSTPLPTPSFPSQLLTGSVAAADAGPVAGAGSTAAEAPLTSWGTFTSGAPLDFPIDSTPRSFSGTNNNSNQNTKGNTMLSAAGWGNGASQDFLTMPASTSTPLLAASASPTPPMPRTNAHQDAWDNWGVQAPVVVNTPNTATTIPPIRSAAPSTSLTTSNSQSTTSGNTNDGFARGGEVVLPLSSTSTLTSAAIPVTAPAPGDVMDELFAGLSSYNAGVSSSDSRSVTNSAVLHEVQRQQPHRQTLGDFF